MIHTVALTDRAVGVIRCWAFALLVFAFSGGAALAQEAIKAPEARVKAAFLFKFGSYVEWPASSHASAAAPFTIGVMEAVALADELGTVAAGRSINGRQVVVRRLRRGDPVVGLDILFIGRTGNRELAETLAVVAGRATLAVTESENALDYGSMVNFVIVDGKVRFDVSLKPADAAGLRISSRLLAVARKVVGPP